MITDLYRSICTDHVSILLTANLLHKFMKTIYAVSICTVAVHYNLKYYMDDSLFFTGK